MSNVDFDFWLFVAGLGLFLFGMFHLETGLKGLAGKSFKRMIQRFTNKNWKGILTGASVTAILQSSSLVTLLVVAFLGSGMMTLHNSLAVVFGANLGTTVTAWIVTTFGFKINVAGLSFPFLAIGILTYLLTDKRPVLKNLGSFLIGFGLLFLGLDYMKSGIETVAGQVDLTQFSRLGLLVFVLIGLVFTALLQSSSAMIVIVLSSLNAGLIDIHQSVALVIGANIGTTSTVILASINGTADKKRLAAGNVFFKLVAGTIGFLLLDKLVYFVMHYLYISEPLMELVLINTLLNLMGIILFYPFIHLLARFLKTRFKKSEPQGRSLYIKNVTPEVVDIAIKAFEKELQHVYELTQAYIIDCLRINNKSSGLWSSIFKIEVAPIEKYEHLKQMEDEITEFYKHLQEQKLSESEAEITTLYMSKLRSMIYAAKNIKDVVVNIKDIDDSEDKVAKDVLKQLQDFAIEKSRALKQIISQENIDDLSENWQKEYELFYNTTIRFLYNNIDLGVQRAVPVSSIVNAIRKTVSSLEELTRSISNLPSERKLLDRVFVE